MPAKSPPDAQTIAPVRPGVFFSTPGPLPRGRHALSRERVQDAQRERILIAITELLAARGYGGFAVTDVAGRAGVSLGGFYDSFEDKAAAAFAGYDRFVEVLLSRIVAIKASGPPADVAQRFLGAYLATLESDLVVARAYQVEIDALGPPMRKRHRESGNLFATHFRNASSGADGDRRADERPWSTYIGIVYTVRQMASDALDGTGDPDLRAVGDDLRAWIAETLP